MHRLAVTVFCLALLLPFLGARTAHAVTIANFNVSVTGVISGVAPGSLNGNGADDPEGFGLGGTATLDDAGTLTLFTRTRAITEFTDTVQDREVLFIGTQSGATLVDPTGEFRTLACTDLGGTLNGCDFASTSGTLPSPPTVLANLPSSIVFDLSLGGVTLFAGDAIVPGTTTVHTYTLTTIPEPGITLLVGLGAAWLSRTGRSRTEY